VKKINLALLGLVLVIAALLRFLPLGDFPPAVNWDEVSHGYNAYSILLTGRDEWGQPFPIFNFRAYGDYPLPLSMYLMIPFIFIGGLTEAMIRLPHGLAGLVTVVAVFFLARELLKNERAALLAALLAAVGPWYVFPSRFVTQPNLSVALTVLAMAVFLSFRKRMWGWGLALFFLILSLFSYHTARVFSPLLLGVMLWLYRGEWLEWMRKKKKGFWLLVGMVGVFLGLWLAAVVSPVGRARSQWVFLVDQGAVNQIIAAREESELPAIVARIVYNRPVYFVSHFVQNYLGYFSPGFLFFEGGTNYQFSVPGKGLLYPINLIGFYFGLVVVFLRVGRGERSWRLVLFWLLLSPVVASATKESHAVLRASTMLPLPEILSACGWWWIIDFVFRKKGKWVGFGLIGVYALGLTINVYDYYSVLGTKYAKEYDWSWQYGYKQVLSLVRSEYEGVDRVFITKKYGEPHEFVLFFWPWNPEAFRNDLSLVRYWRDGWYWVDGFGKFRFINDWEIKDKVVCGGGERCMLVSSPGNYPEQDGWNVSEGVNYLSGKSAFEILRRGDVKKD